MKNIVVLYAQTDITIENRPPPIVYEQCYILKFHSKYIRIRIEESSAKNLGDALDQAKPRPTEIVLNTIYI